VYSDLKDGRRGRNDVGIIPNKYRIPELCQGTRAWEAFGHKYPADSSSLNIVGRLKPNTHGLKRVRPDIVRALEPVLKVPWNPERAQNNSHE
jgi:hypothetical protein